MRLPDAERAVVEDAKARDYLLAADHPVGWAEARFFAALGSTWEGWSLLGDALLAVARGEAEPGEPTVFGQPDAVRGIVRDRGARGLDGRRADRLDRAPRRGRTAAARCEGSAES
jgi:hypothetical protein